MSRGGPWTTRAGPPVGPARAQARVGGSTDVGRYAAEQGVTCQLSTLAAATARPTGCGPKTTRSTTGIASCSLSPRGFDQPAADHLEIRRIAEEVKRRRVELGKASGFERLYARVTTLYFGGMARPLADLRAILRPGARLALRRRLTAVEVRVGCESL